MLKKLLFGMLVLSTVIYAKESGALKVSVEKFGKIKGDVKIAVYASKDGFPMEGAKAVTSASIKVDNAKVSYTFEKMAYGEYAVSVYYDENSNNKLDAGFMGIPKEAVGASNDAKGKMGPPSFDDAKFLLNAEYKEINIKLAGIK